jgi:DNA-binding MarR family transcriptional regulator
MDHNEILINLRRIARMINLESKRIQKQHSVSIPQLLSLRHIASMPEGRTTQRELRDYLKLNSSTVTGIIQRLSQKGMLVKLESGPDRRVNHIGITNLGRKVIEESPELLQVELSRKLESMPEETRSVIRDGLDELVRLFELREVEAGPILSAEEDLN